MFFVRLRSSILLMLIAIPAIILGGYWLFGVLLFVSLVGVMELYRVYQINKQTPALIGYLTVVGYYLILLFKREALVIPLLLAFLLILMMLYVFTFPKFLFQQMAITLFGIFYVAIMISYIYQVRLLEGGAYSVWLIFIGSWGSDTCAYLTGITLGKHRIAPVLSPKKSLEGCIGGVLGAALIGFIYATIFKSHISGVSNPQLAYAVISACCSVISQVGDLAASAIKRQNSIKDYGKLLPGHGGILDRFDSVIYTAPICYALMMIL